MIGSRKRGMRGWWEKGGWRRDQRARPQSWNSIAAHSRGIVVVLKSRNFAHYERRINGKKNLSLSHNIATSRFQLLDPVSRCSRSFRRGSIPRRTSLCQFALLFHVVKRGGKTRARFHRLRSDLLDKRGKGDGSRDTKSQTPV